MNAAPEALVIAKTHRVPLPAGPGGDAAAAVRQFDAVAMRAGFKLSGRLMERLAALDAGAVTDLAARVLAVVRGEAGDHVQHNETSGPSRPASPTP